MAIDTRDKRSSAAGIGSPCWEEFPLPDSTIDALDRQHVSMAYRGIAADPPVIIVTNGHGMRLRPQTIGVPVGSKPITIRLRRTFI